MENAPESNGLVINPAAVKITGKIFVIAILVFLFVVVFAIIFCIFVKWLSWRIELSSPPRIPNRHQRQRRNLNFTSAQGSGFVMSRRALEPAVIGSIPIVMFDAKEFKDGLECAVCLSELIDGEKTRLLPKCNHGFHVDCIDMWFKSHSTCPLCRNQVAQESHIITIK
ncbi:hypothetical protein ACFE04_026290 [Oxalis oulophora]